MGASLRGGVGGWEVLGRVSEEVESSGVGLGGQMSHEELFEVFSAEVPVLVNVVGLHELLALIRGGSVLHIDRSIEIGDEVGSFLRVNEAGVVVIILEEDKLGNLTGRGFVKSSFRITAESIMAGGGVGVGCLSKENVTV